MATIKKFINDLTGQEKAQKEAQQEAALLVKLANFKLDALENLIRDKYRNKQLEGQIELIGDRLNSFIKGYRVNVDDGQIGDAINGIISAITNVEKEDTRKVISKTIQSTLAAMFSTSVVEEQQQQVFIVTFEGLALVRYDFYVWRYNSSSNGVFKNIKSVLAYTYSRSTIDPSKVSPAELAQAVFESMGSKATPSQVAEYVKEMQAVYQEIRKLTDIEIKEKAESAGMLSDSALALVTTESLPDLD